MPDTKQRESLTIEEYLKAQEEYCDRAKYAPFYWVIATMITFALGIFGLVLYTYAKKGAAPPSAAETLAGPAHGGMTFQAFAAKAFVPYLIVAGLLLAGAAAYAIIQALRCPHCRQYFARGKLKLHDKIESTWQTTDNQGHLYGGHGATAIYWTECKYCGKVILVYR